MDEIYHVRKLKQNALIEDAERDGVKQRVADMAVFLNEQAEQIDIYDEQLARRLIEKIIVYDDRYTVTLKSGTSLNVGR